MCHCLKFSWKVLKKGTFGKSSFFHTNLQKSWKFNSNVLRPTMVVMAVKLPYFAPLPRDGRPLRSQGIFSFLMIVYVGKKISAFEINSVAPVNAIPEIPKSQEYNTYILHLYYIYTLHAERWYAKKNVQLAPLAPLGPIGRQ